MTTWIARRLVEGDEVHHISGTVRAKARGEVDETECNSVGLRVR